MKVLSPLFGYFGKSGSKTNTPEEGDTRLTVPGLLQPTIEMVFPCFQLFSAPLPGGANTPVNSWIYSEEFTYNTLQTPIIANLGPGLWDLSCSIIVRESGAVSDATSTARLDFFDILNGQTVTLLRVSNKQGLDQSELLRFKILVTGDSLYSFNKVTQAGAGTGANVCKITIVAQRLF
jgi:hypothetical protein